jgi:Tol biopolymer transport system component/DNA-binding winged helix-turn-helix (wHTH) protein
MPEVPQFAQIFRFGIFEVDIACGELRKHGSRVRLQEQPFQVLVSLLDHAGELVSRDELFHKIWPPDTFVDFEQGLGTAIKKLRQSLGDDADAPRYIETLPKRGYRFIAAVEKSAGRSGVKPDQVSGAVLQLGPKASISDAVAKPASRHWRIASIAMVALAFVAIAFWLMKHEAVISVASISTVTSYPGDEREPSMSPDGRQVAFSWDGEDGHRHIYVTVLGEQHPLRLTRDAGEDTYPAWSPDGKQIAFIRRQARSEGYIMLMQSIGGPERMLHRIQLGYLVAAAGRMMAWSPDGKWLCFTSELAPSTHHGLFLLSVDSGNVRPLFAEPSAGIADSSPAFSPDGRWLALARFSGPDNSKLLLQRLTANLEPDGEPLLVSNTSGNAKTPVWLADSSSILLLDNSDSGSSGSRIMQARIGHPARLVYAANASLDGLTLDGSGSRLVAAHEIDDSDIWSLPLKGLTTAGSAERILYSTAEEAQPRFSPDGRSLVFRSKRSGADEIWLADSNGENPRQLTHIAAYIAGFPHWSPDSQLIVFHARLPDEPQIYTVRAEDGVIRRVTQQSPGFVVPSFSLDGKAIYMLQPLNGVARLHSVSLIGGEPQALWLGSDPMESPGRNLLLYTKFDQQGIYAHALSGNAAKKSLRFVWSRITWHRSKASIRCMTAFTTSATRHPGCRAPSVSILLLRANQ